MLLEACLLSGRADYPGLAFQSTKAFPGKIRASPSGVPLLPSLPLIQPQLSLANADCQLGVGTRILWLSGPVHPSSMLVDQGLTQLPAWQRPGVWGGAKVVPCGERGKPRGRKQGQEEGGHKLAGHQAWGKEKQCGCFHWTDEETEAQRGDVTCPRSQSWQSALLWLLLGHRQLESHDQSRLISWRAADSCSEKQGFRWAVAIVKTCGTLIKPLQYRNRHMEGPLMSCPPLLPTSQAPSAPLSSSQGARCAQVPVIGPHSQLPLFMVSWAWD